MKIGSAVLGVHIAALVAFALSQGCVTTESQGSGRGAGARHKGPWSHEHKGKAVSAQPMAAPSYYPEGQQQPIYDPLIIETETAKPAPRVRPTSSYGNTQTYVVQKGDVLSRLAVEFNTTTSTLIEMNNLANPDVLYVGQELNVPAGVRKQAAAKKSAPVVKKGGDYIIQPGDTLSQIAAAAGVSLADLRAVNNLDGDKIIAGEKLAIPSGGTIPQKAAKKAEPVAETKVSEPAPAPVASTAVEPVETSSMEVDAVMDHVVYPGETLDDISRQYGVSKSDIMRLNSISEESAIKEGQRLRIPITE